MMRFLLDCLRPGRQRAGCGRENSVEIPTKERDPGNENELKDMEDVVAMEEGALQRDRAQCRDSQQDLESLAKRRAQLKEEIERIQEQRKQEGQLLLSLQEEQEELEQRVQEYDGELKRAKEELQRLQEEISSTRARVEEVHGRIGPLKHCIGETYTEITEAKQRLGELITEMIAIETCAPEITSQQATESLNVTANSSSREEDEDAEVHCRLDEKALKHCSVENEPSEQEHEDGPEKLQRSAENLKSSGSSSFTEITLTEFKEEDASPRSITSQHTGSADLEEEDFEIVQSLMSKPVNQTASKEFDFFHPDPFVDYDVFGDERFPKVDMTEFLSGDPFKGSDPFACDNLFSDVANSPFPQDSPISEEGNAKESNPLTLSPESASKEDPADISNVAHIPAGSKCSQSIDSGMFEQNIPELAESDQHVSYTDVCPQVGIEITVTQDLDTIGNELDLPASPKIEDGGHFDPIVCEHNDIQDSESSSTVESSFDGDFGIAEDHPEEEPEVEAGPSYVKRNQALYGLQRIDTSSYTGFPLSPDAYDPEPFPVSSDVDEKPSSFSSDHNTVTEIKPEMELIEDTANVSPHIDPGSPSPPNQEIHDVKCEPCSLELKEDHFSNTNDATHNEEPSDSDDHKFGDIYFFTVRLDPGSSDTSPVSPEVSEKKKSEAEHASPGSVDMDEFDYAAPEDENPKQCSFKDYPEESFDREAEVRSEQPSISPETNEPTESEAEDSQSSPVSPEVSEKKKSEAEHASPGSVDMDEFDYAAPEDEDLKQCSFEDYPEESFDREEAEVRTEQPSISPEPNEPIESEAEDPHSSPVSPEVSEKKKSEAEHASPEFVDMDEFDYAAPEDEDLKQCSFEDYPEESFDREEAEVRSEQPSISPEPNEPIESEAKDPHSSPVSPEAKDQSPGLDHFECNIFDLECNSVFNPQSENKENADLDSSVDTNSESCNAEPVVQYLISPVSGDTGMFATDGYKLCARNPFSFDVGSIDYCENTEMNPEPPNSETCVINESGSSETSLQSLVLLDPVLIGNPIHAFEAKNPNTDSGRLDSGYHEFSGLDPFSPAPTDSRPESTELGPGSVTENLQIVVPNPINLDVQVSDPFSPESSDTTIFDSEPEICNPATNDGITNDSGLGCTGSSDVLAESFSGSEFDSFDPFSPMPHLTGSNYAHSNMDILVPGSVQDDSRSYGDYRSSSWDSGVSQSPQLHCDSAPNRADPLLPLEANLVSPDTQSLSYSSSYSTTDFIFQSDSSTFTDVGSFSPKVEKITVQDKNSTVSVTAMEDLAEIDFFCSELSKMVASRSSDSVQQSVTEMLFGSNPDTAKFYPWDLENSSTDIKETSSPEVDFGHTPDEAEKPSLL
ncbi:microtubule-associated protein 1B [Ictalurus furcatus]|uniref:microtubule-associated protein 1B n=1 Tax=Ictalurus furcatus TaxID=66913 RepID=UPI002350043A|nr:microtubule-associated protein 1B [Ictalurus furcatus]